MCRLRNIAMRDYPVCLPDRHTHTDRQTDAGQSDPFVPLKPQSDIRCNRFATSPRLTISTNRRGRNKVPDRSRRGCREVGD